MTLKIAIIGCGIGGLACALYLTKSNHDVTIYDKFERPAPVGSGLVIQPVGQDVLEELGCRQDVISSGAKIFKMFGIESDQNKPVLHVDYAAGEGPIFGLGIHRATLFDILFKAMGRTSVKLRPAHIIDGTHIENGQRFISVASGKNYGPFDLVIDCSGAHSQLSPIKASPLRFGALWGTVDWPENTPLPENQLSQCYQKANKMMGVLPIGRLPNGTHNKATIFWSEPRSTLPNWPNGELSRWKNEAISLWPHFAPFINQIETAQQMTATTYNHGTLFRPYAARLAILGDAAHQASPQLGQGANMALLDAQALCHALKTYDVDTALKTYAKQRFFHIQLYQIFSRIFTPFYQSDSDILPWLRNHIMHPFSRTWPMKFALTRLVCGNLIRP